MSRTVDERIVAMQFDNAQFERNVATSMSTLDKLKKKLNFKDSSKSLEEVGRAANTVNFNAVEKSLTAIEKKFSTTSIAIMRYKQKMIDSVVSFVKNGVISGGIRRAMNLENAQFQLNVLLKDANEVTKVMENVNAAVDGTAYSLDAAATVASQLAASGMRAGEQMQQSLQAVAGVAAMTNSSYEDIGRIFTQIAGQGRLMGNDLLQLSGRGMNAAATLGEALGKTEAEVRDMVSKGQVSFEMFSEAMYNAFGEGAKKANDTFNGALSNLKSSFARIGALFVSPLIESKGPIVTLFNTLRERVNDLKADIVPIADGVVPVIKNIIDTITKYVQKFGEVMDPIKKAMDPLKDIVDTITLPIDSIKKVTASITDLGSVVDDVILGKFGNAPTRFEDLTAAGYNWCEVQNKVNERLGCSKRYTQEQIDAQNKLLGVQKDTTAATEKTSTAVQDLTEDQKALIKQHIKLDDETLKGLGYTKEQIKAFQQLRNIAAKLGMPIDDFIDKMDKMSAQWIIFDSFKNIGLAIVDVLKSIGKAFVETFKPITSNQVFNAIAGFHKFSESLALSEANADKLKRTFKGLFAAIDIVRTITGGALTIAFKVLAKVLGNANLNILDVTSRIGDSIVNLRNLLLNNKFINGAVNLIVKGIEKVSEIFGKLINFIAHNPVTDSVASIWDHLFGKDVSKTGKVIINTFKSIRDSISQCVNEFLKIPGVQKIIQKVSTGLTTLFDSISAGINNISIDGFCKQLSKAFNQLQQWIKGLKNSEHLGSDIVRGIVNGLRSGVSSAVNGIISIVTAIKDTFCNLFGIHSPSKWGIETGGYIIEGISLGLQKGVSTLQNAISYIVDIIKSGFKNISLSNTLESVKGAFNFDFSGPMKVLNKIKEYLLNFAEFLKGLDLKYLLALIPIGLVLVTTKKIFDSVKILESGIQSVNGVLDALKGAIGKFGGLADACKKQIQSKALRNMAISIGILAASVAVLTLVDQDKLFNAVTVIILLAGVMAALAFAMSKMETASVSIEKSGVKIDSVKASLLAIGTSILMLAVSIKLIGSMDADEFTRGIKGMTAAVLALIGLITTIGIVGKLGDLSAIDGVGTMILKVSIAMLLMVKVCQLAAQLKPEEMKKGAIFAAGFTVFIIAMAGCYRIAGNSVNKLGGTMIKTAIALALMVGVCKLAAQLKPEELKKGALFATGFTAFVLAMAGCYRVAGKSVSKIGRMMIAMTIAMGLMVGVCKLVGKLSNSEMERGAIFAAGFAVFVAALVKATTIAKTQQIGKVAGTILAVSIAMGMMAGLCILIGLIPNDMWGKGVVAVTAFAAMIAIMVNSAKGVGDIKGTIMMMAVSIGVMAAAVAALTFVDQDKLRNSSACLAGLMAMFAVMESQASKVQKASLAIGLMAATIAVIGVVLIELSKVPAKESIAAATSLSIAMLSLSVALGVIGATGELSNRAMASVAIMTGALLGIGVVIKSLSEIQNVDDAIKIAISLSLVLLAMSAAMLILSKITESGTNISSLLKFAAVVGILTLAISTLAPALQSTNTVGWDSLAKLGVALVVLSVGLKAMNGSISGASAMLVAAAALKVFVPVLQTLGQMSMSEIGHGLLALAGAFAVIGVAGLLLGPITPIIIALSAALAILGVAALTFGAGAALLGVGLNLILKAGSDAAKQLVESIGIITIGILQLIPQITSALLQAIVAVCDVLTQAAPQIATTLVTLLTSVIQSMVESKMEFVGSIVDLLIEVLSGLTEKLPELLNTLSNFVVTLINGLAEHMPEFITAAVNLVSQIVKGIVDNLAPIINNIIVPLLSTLGTVLTNLLTVIAPYIPDIVNGLTLITQAVCEMVSRVVEALAPMLPNIENIVSSICGVFTTLIGQIAPIIDSISGLVQQLGSSISMILISLGTSFQQLGSAIKTALDGIADIISSVGEAISSGLEGIADIISSVGEAINESLEGVADVITSVGDTISSVFESIGDVITSIGDSIRNVLDGIADIISAIGEAALNAGRGFEKLANGVKTITNLDLFDMGASLAAVAKGLKNIVKHADGLATAGEGMQKIVSGAKESSTAFMTIGSCVTTMVASLRSIGSIASASMAALVSAVTSSGASFTILNTSITSTMSSMSATVIGQSYAIVSAFDTMMTSVVSAITSRQAYFSSAGSSMMISMSLGVSSGAALVISSVNSAMGSIGTSVQTKSGAFSGAGRKLMNSLRTGINSGTSGVLSQLNTIMTNMRTMIISRGSVFMSAGVQLMNSLSGGIRNGGSRVNSALTSALSGCSATIRSYYFSFVSAGSFLGAGLITGINSKLSDVYKAGYRLGEKAVTGEKAGQQSASPSKLTRKAGRWLGEGLIIGMKEMSTAVYSSGKSMGRSASDSITEALSSISNIDDWNVDTDPSITIHPVFDMSNIDSGLNYIDSALSGTKAVQLSSSVAAITPVSSLTNQNGSNQDVVNAINKLRKDIGSKTGNTYNLGGITYDDGSNVADAVESLVRAVKIEGRR